MRASILGAARVVTRGRTLDFALSGYGRSKDTPRCDCLDFSRMGGRFAVAVTIVGVLALAPAAHAEDFSLQHRHEGVLTATAQGGVTFGTDGGGATVSLTVTDRAEDGWCAIAWVTSNLPPATHTSRRVCGVAKQETFTISLPGGARCNIAFVEVTAGRIDPSNGNAIEVGQAKRMANPCPPPPPPTPAPPPPPPPPTVDSRISFNWTATRRWTRNNSLTVRNVPPGARVELRCRGRGCPSKRARSVSVRNGRANAHRLLRRRHLRPGALVEVRVTRADMIGKVGRFRIRSRRVPNMQQLCLPPGARSPQRC
jgi:hypothetical protein